MFIKSKKVLASKFYSMLLFSFILTSCAKEAVQAPTLTITKNFHLVDDSDFRLHYVSIGSKFNQPVLFIHGAPGNWTAYENLLADKVLQSNYQLISVDRLGYGSSRKGNPKLASIKDQARLIVQALNSNQSGQKAIVIGRSYGAPIAAKIAAEHPDLVEKVVLISPVIDPDKEKYFWFAYASKHWIVSQFLPNEYNTATDEKFDHAAELRKMEKDWDKIEAEVTVFTGGQDWIADTKNFDYAKKRLSKLSKKKKSKFIFLPEAGHMISESHGDLVKKEILNKKVKSY